jgi:NADH:ubiquinone oxidoreductase subunit 2 (subunit N)
LFSAALRADQNHGLLWLVALALFGSLVSLYYYLIVLKAVFVDEPLSDTASAARTSTSQQFNDASPARTSTSPDFFQRAAITALGGLVLLLGLIPGPLVARIIASLP